MATKKDLVVDIITALKDNTDLNVYSALPKEIKLPMVIVLDPQQSGDNRTITNKPTFHNQIVNIRLYTNTALDLTEYSLAISNILENNRMAGQIANSVEDTDIGGRENVDDNTAHYKSMAANYKL